MCASCSGCHDVGQGNVNILQHVQSPTVNRPIQFYSNNVTKSSPVYKLRKVRHHALQHGDRIVTIYYCDVTSPYLFELIRCSVLWWCICWHWLFSCIRPMCSLFRPKYLYFEYNRCSKKQRVSDFNNMLRRHQSLMHYYTPHF